MVLQQRDHWDRVSKWPHSLTTYKQIIRNHILLLCTSSILVPTGASNKSVSTDTYDQFPPWFEEKTRWSFAKKDKKKNLTPTDFCYLVSPWQISDFAGKYQILFPTKHFTILEPQNILIDISDPHKIRRSKDFRTLRLWNIRSGSETNKLITNCEAA